MKLFDTKIADGRYIIYITQPEAEVDYTCSDDITALVKQGVEQGYKKIHIDLANLKFIDSSGIGRLITATKFCKIALINVNDNVMKLIQLTNIGGYFEFL
jgi:anti-anti-sigma factor